MNLTERIKLLENLICCKSKFLGDHGSQTYYDLKFKNNKIGVLRFDNKEKDYCIDVDYENYIINCTDLIILYKGTYIITFAFVDDLKRIII